ncbi:MAG: hypothetical protein OEZ01_07445 [Candidatus Heimdallarchaeota archaeon]|nr:hypothetical protein [Candidatus Heimdallarchaeota archaeon]
MTKKQTAFEYLKRVKKATSLQIRELVNTVAAGSMIADLRKMGCHIKSKHLYTTDENVHVWEYELLSWPAKLYVK